MKKRRSNKKGNKLIYSIVVCLVAVIGLFTNQDKLHLQEKALSFDKSSASDMEVHFIDVGQADSILIESSDHYMLIDAGNNEDGEMLVKYLQKEGIEKLDYVIATHPHEDHIGGMDNVINNFKVDNVFMPDVTHTTKAFEDVLDTIKIHNLEITIPVPGEQYNLGNAQFTIVAPNRNDYGEALNNYSVGIKLVYGNNSFLMCGDAEEIAEEDILNNGIDISADVYKVSHHGSNTGTSEEFLRAISPQYAVIECGEGNDYGHPHKETLNLLQKMNVEVFRTDLDGTVIASSDGNTITWTTEK